MSLRPVLGAALCVLVAAGCSDAERTDVRKPLSPPVCVHAVYAVLSENPQAKSVCIDSGGPLELKGCFGRAGLRVATNSSEAAKCDIFISSRSDSEVVTARDAVIARYVDVRGMKMGALKKVLESFPLSPRVSRIWMLGEFDWLVVGRSGGDSRVLLGELLDLFAREDSFDDLALARLNSAPMLFADYAGTVESALGAFTDDALDGDVRAEYFLTHDIPEADWIDASGIDGDIGSAVLSGIRSSQVLRRIVVQGAMAGNKEGGEKEALDAWARVALRNPGDLYLAGRLSVLEKNARAFLEIGNLKGAAKCFETLVLVNPADAANMHNYAACMQKLGETNIAVHAFKRAETLRKAAGTK